LRELHPLRVQYQLFSNANPLMAPVAALAEQVCQNRAPAAADNPFVTMQELASRQIIAGLDAWRDLRDAVAESTFMTAYGSPLLQAAVGINPPDARRPRQAGTSPLHRDLVNTRIAELKAKIATGGLREALVRTMLYVAMPRNGVDQRGFQAIRRIRIGKVDGKTHALRDLTTLTLEEFKALVREQFFMLLIDQPAAVGVIPALLPKDVETRRTAFALMRDVLSVAGEVSGGAADRLHEAAVWFGVPLARAREEKVTVLSTRAQIEHAKASQNELLRTNEKT
jgi:hypothetical protein